MTKKKKGATTMAKVAQKQKSAVKSKEETGTAVKKSRADVVRGQIKEFRDQVEEGYLDMSQLMAEIFHKEFYLEWGFDTFQDYVSKELDFEIRKAEYFVKIWDKTKALNLPRAELHKLGWTKIKDLINVMTAENAQEWLKRAKDMSTREVTDAVRITRRVDPNVPRPATVITLKLVMSESEANIITEALGEAKQLCNTTNDVLALEMICQDWMQEKCAKPTMASLKDQVKYIERAYGVKVTTTAKTKEEKAAEEEKAAKAAKKEPPAKAAKKEEKKTEKKADKKSEKKEEKAPAKKGKEKEELLDPADFSGTTSKKKEKVPEKAEKNNKKSSKKEEEDVDVNSLLGL
jgi:DNA polymerase III gamma/tau subunit